MNEQQLLIAYQPLITLIKERLNIDLSLHDALDINDAITEVNENLRTRCDVYGCDESPCTGGTCWPDTGYWCICTTHSYQYRKGEAQPQMKTEAVIRESIRDARGYLPIQSIS